MTHFLKSIAVVVVLCGSFAAHGLTLDEARSKNMVKELPSGYLESVSPDAKAFVEETNQKRRKHYESIAKENKIPVDEVAKKAAVQLQKK